MDSEDDMLFDMGYGFDEAAGSQYVSEVIHDESNQAFEDNGMTKSDNDDNQLFSQRVEGLLKRVQSSIAHEMKKQMLVSTEPKAVPKRFEENRSIRLCGQRKTEHNVRSYLASHVGIIYMLIIQMLARMHRSTANFVSVSVCHMLSSLSLLETSKLLLHLDVGTMERLILGPDKRQHQSHFFCWERYGIWAEVGHSMT
ncbi:hypothetical protein MHU86_22207 [Fragilaria crotonensis]|nr:hypothetical protein MHU86_22207 [Fragilaria crotonensis]